MFVQPSNVDLEESNYCKTLARMTSNKGRSLQKTLYKQSDLVEQVQSRVKGLFEWRSRTKIQRSNVVAGVLVQSLLE